MDARFHLNRWRMTGVCPRGAQVRRTTGSSEAPDSSQNTITAWRRRALRQILGPVLGHPAGDGLLVTLDGTAGGTLQPPAHAAQRLLSTLAPAGVPAADVLSGYPQLAGDLGLGVAGGKQGAGLHADAFERLAVAQTAGVAAVGGWSHPAMLPGEAQPCHRN